MPQINEYRRSSPPYPDPLDTDQRRINMQLVEVVRYLEQRIDKSNMENRISSLEATVNNHDDVING